MQETSTWGLVTIIGPIILLVLFVWVIARNRQSKVSKDVTDRATEANYQAEDRAAKDAEGR
jgi:hypothetical protein